MSIGIGGKIFGKGFELFLGRREYGHTFRLAKASILDYGDEFQFSLLTFELAVRW